MGTNNNRLKISDKKFSPMEIVVPLERDIDYYLQKGNHYFMHNNWIRSLLFFKKAIELEPDDPLHHYNLGCLFSKMGRLEEANQCFKYIIDTLDPSYWECYFLMAVNYGIMENQEKAIECLQFYLLNAPDGEMATEAQELIWIFGGVDDIDEVLFFEEDPLQEEYWDEVTGDLLVMSKKDFLTKYSRNPSAWQVLKRILYQGSESQKEESVNYLGWLKTEDTRAILLEFIRNPWVKDHLKQVAMLKLKNMGFKGTCQAFLMGKSMEINIDHYPLKAPFWKDDWQNVLSCLKKKIGANSNYNEKIIDDAQTMWIDFINGVYPNVPSIKKPETWAAGLEYSLNRFHFIRTSQEEVAKSYGVSSSSVRAKFKQINSVLNIGKNAYKNMLTYFFRPDDKD